MPCTHWTAAGTVIYEQWWESETDLNRHLRSELYQQVVLVMEMAKEIPV